MIERTDDEFIKSTITENLLNRNKKLIYCVDFLLNQTNNSVISINGKWGSGKTVFAKQIEYVMKHEEEYRELNRKYIRKENTNYNTYEIFYYNSWENDSINMPVHSLLLQLIKYYNVKSDTPLDLKQLSKKAFNIMTKLATHGAVDIEKLKSNKTEDEKINALLNDVISTEDLKEFFNNIIDQILAEKNNRLLIIVDELDRCRPTYAIEMLECIKHFYSNDKITFLVVTDNIQLSKTIKKVYGSEYDGELYLNRFYDVSINLSNNQSAKSDYAANILTKRIDQMSTYNEIIKSCIKYFDLELRQINVFMKNNKQAEIYFEKGEITANAKCIKLLSILFCDIAYALKTSFLSEFEDYIAGKWKNLRKFLVDNSNLIQLFKRYEFIKNIATTNEEVIDAIEKVYYYAFLNYKVQITDKLDFLEELEYYDIKNSISFLLELQY